MENKEGKTDNRWTRAAKDWLSRKPDYPVKIIWPCKHTEDKAITHWLCTADFNHVAFYNDGRPPVAGFFKRGWKCSGIH